MTDDNQFLINFVSDLREDIRGIRADIKEIILSINNHKLEIESKANQEEITKLEGKLEEKADKKLVFKIAFVLLCLILSVAVATNSTSEIANFIIRKG